MVVPSPFVPSSPKGRRITHSPKHGGITSSSLLSSQDERRGLERCRRSAVDEPTISSWACGDVVAVNPTYHDIHMEARLPDQQAEDRRRSVIVQLPPRLQCQHSTSLAKLTPEGWRLAQLAAVMPQPFVFEVVAQVMGKPVADLVPALLDALSARATAPTPSALTFRHDRVRQATYEQVPAPLRLALLRRVERLGPEIGIGTAAEAQEVGEAQDSSLVDCDMADRHMAGRSNDVSAAGPATPTPATSADLAESETGISVSGSVVGWAVPGDLAVARCRGGEHPRRRPRARYRRLLSCRVAQHAGLYCLERRPGGRRPLTSARLRYRVPFGTAP